MACVLVVVVVGGGCWLVGERVGGDDATTDEMSEVEIGEDAETEESEPAEPLPRLESEHFESFDLLKNRPLAHRTIWSRAGRSSRIDAAEFDFVRYIAGNHREDWLVDADVDDGQRRIAAVRGRRGRLDMPAFGDDAETVELRVFNPVDEPNELTARIGEYHLEPYSLEPGWQTVEFELEERTVGADVRIDLEFSNLGRIDGVLSGGGVDWIRLGPREGGESDEFAGLITEQREPMRLEPGRGLSWIAWLHADARLELVVDAKPGCGPTVEFGLQTDDGEVTTVVDEAIELVEGRGDRQETVVDPGIEDEQVGRLDIGLPANSSCDVVEIETARLVRPGSIDGVPEEFEPPEHVVFWLVDTLRADYLPLHFETDVEAPNFERLAEEGVSFETAYVQGTESRASHASLFTGDYPSRHQVMEGGTVNPYRPILSHLFAENDYATANLAANGYVSHLLNLDRGWDYYRNYVHEEVALDARALLDDGLDWIDERDDESFFLYFGTVDPHATYRRHDDFIGLYEDDDYQGRFRQHLSGEKLGEIKAGEDIPTETEKARIVDLYKNEITYNDHVFGELRRELEERGIWEETLVVITSDHGEEFWERGSVGHGHSVYQEMVHVPLLFHYPRGLPSGRTVRSGGEVVDVLPTLRDMIGAEALDDDQGRSLLPVILGEDGGYPAPVVATQYGRDYALQIRDWNLVIDGSGVELFDRSDDPGAKHDVIDDHPLASRWLRDSFGWFRAHRRDWDKSSWGVANDVSERFVELARGESDE